MRSAACPRHHLDVVPWRAASDRVHPAFVRNLAALWAQASAFVRKLGGRKPEVNQLPQSRQGDERRGHRAQREVHVPATLALVRELAGRKPEDRPTPVQMPARRRATRALSRSARRMSRPMRSAAARRISRPAQRASGRRARQNARVTQAAANPAARAASTNTAATNTAPTNTPATNPPVPHPEHRDHEHRIYEHRGHRRRHHRRRSVDQSTHRRGARRPREPGRRGRGRAARRRGDRAVHRAVPQGSHRHTRRRPAAHARGAAALPARAGRAPRRRPRVDPRAGQARRRARGRRSWRPTRRRGWRTSTCRTSRSGGRRRRSPARPASSRSPTPCSPTRPPTRATARRLRRRRAGVADAAAALDGARSILVERFAEDADLIGELRELMWSRGRLVRRCGTASRTPAPSSPTTSTSPSRSPKLPSHRILAHVPRREGGGARPHARSGAGRARRGAAQAGPTALRARIAATFGVADRGPPRRQMARRHRALGLAYPDPGASRRRPAQPAVPGGRGRGGPGVRRRTSATCCSPRRPAPGRRWVWTPDSVPA